MSSYDHYVKDKQFLDYYNEYQKRYASQMAERDKVMLKLIATATAGQPASLLDIGCSTGNLLLHTRRFFSNLTLFGGELAESSLEAARANPELQGVTFQAMDMLDIPGQYDVIVCNAVTYLFDNALFDKAIASVAKALKPGGTFIDFEWFNPFDQHLEINEKSQSHPDGLTIHVRTYREVRAALTKAGLSRVQFNPFHMPIDLPPPDMDGDVITYTKKMEDGDRLSMRGVLNQPWCHMVAGC